MVPRPDLGERLIFAGTLHEVQGTVICQICKAIERRPAALEHLRDARAQDVSAETPHLTGKCLQWGRQCFLGNEN